MKNKNIISLITAIILIFITVSAQQPIRVFAYEAAEGVPVLDRSVLDGIHPRIFLDPAEAEALRQKITTRSDYEPYWSAITQAADGIIAIPPLEYIENSDDGWMRDRIGNNIGNIAFMYLMTGDKKYYDAAEALALAACSYPTWGRGADLNTSLSAAHILAGMGLFYDWCYDAMPESTRETVRNKLIERGTTMFKASKDTSTFWSREWLQNHMYIHTTGMLIAGTAIMDEYPAAAQWYDQAHSMFANTFKYLNDEGSNHEGPMYFVYGKQFLFMYMDLAKKFYHLDYFDHPWFKEAAKYVTYSMFPEEHWTYQINHFNLADDEYGWDGGLGPDHLLFRFAKEYNDGHTQYFAEKIFEKGVGRRLMLWCYILWNDQDVEAIPPKDMPTTHYFPDMGLLYARSGWQNNESVLMFKSGPYLGHKATNANKTDPYLDWGGGHVHTDANHFSLFAEGDNQLVDDGYSLKYTNSHNTLLIDNKGQVGEGYIWFRHQDAYAAKSLPTIVKTETNDVYDYMVGDAKTAYAPATGLTKYNRHILFIKPDILLVVDDIASTDPHNYELRFFPSPQNAVEQADGSYYVQNLRSKLVAKPIYTDEGSFSAENVVLYSGKPNVSAATPVSSEHLAFRAIKKDTDSFLNAVAFSWSPNNAVPAKVTGAKNGNIFTFTVRGERYSIDVSSMNVSVPEREEALTLYYNGKIVNSPPMHFLLAEKEKLLPVRALFEAIGGRVEWDAVASAVNIEFSGKTASFTEEEDGVIISDGRLHLTRAMIEKSFNLDVMINENSNKVLVEDYKATDGLTEMKLNNILINNLKIKGYSPDVKEYNIVNTWGNKQPEISVIPEDISAVAEVKYENNKITVTCRSRDGSLSTDYIFNINNYIGFGNIPVYALSESDGSEFYLGMSIDGDMSTNSTSDGDGEWGQYDFGEERKVAAIGIAPYIGNTRKAYFDILTSKDGESWTTVYSGGSSGTTSNFEYYDMKDTVCRYVRLLFRGNSTNQKNSFLEVAFFDTVNFAKDLEINIDKPMLRLNETAKAEVLGSMFNGSPLDIKNGELKFFVDNTDVVELENGVLTALKKGSAVITANYSIDGFTIERTRMVEVSDGIYLDEDFEGYTDGSSIVGGSWQAGFGDEENQASVKVMPDGNKVLKITATTQNLITNATYTLNKFGKMVFEADIMSDSTKGQKAFRLFDSKPSLYGPLISMGQNGDIVSYDVDHEYILRTYRKNIWYSFKLELDLDTQLTNVYIDGRLYAQNIGMRAKEGNGNPYNWENGIRSLRIDAVSQDGSTVNFYIDNLKIYEMTE